MKFKTGDKIVHDVYGAGTIQVAGINGVCQVAFNNGNIKIVKTNELTKIMEIKK